MTGFCPMNKTFVKHFLYKIASMYSCHRKALWGQVGSEQFFSRSRTSVIFSHLYYSFGIIHLEFFREFYFKFGIYLLVEQWSEGRWFKSPAALGWDRATCWSILEQDTEPQNSSWCAVGTLWGSHCLSKDPAMSWRLIQGVPWPSPMSRTGFGPSKPRHPSGG